MMIKIIVKIDGEDVEAEVSDLRLAEALRHPDTMAMVLSRWFNLGGKGFHEGRLVGQQLTVDHNTIQQLAIGFCFGILEAFSDMSLRRVDARNEAGVRACKKLYALVRDGEIDTHFPFI
jgi:hypothetical protein